MRPLPARRYLFVIYSAACERVLAPVARALAADPDAEVVAVLAGPRDQQRRLLPGLRAAGCRIDRLGLSLMRAQTEPRGAVVVQCLDHRLHYRHHRLGVDIADALRAAGAATVCLQHGGTREDSLASLASAASETILVWGRYAEQALIRTYGIAPGRLRITGNPLHDPLSRLSTEQARTALRAHAPDFVAGLGDRQLLLLASTIQREYADRPDEVECYRRYLRHLYASLDFSRQALVVKMHPCDLDAGRNLYQELRPEGLPVNSLLIIPAGQGPDVYALLKLCDLLLTRCSTVAEEALLLGKPVLAFDLDAQGPAQAYAHLARWGRYRLVHVEPAAALSSAIADSFSQPDAAGVAEQAVVELGHALDGQSLQRTLAALRQLA